MTDELKQWEYDRGYEKGKADGIDEMVLKLETNMPSKLDEKERYGYTVALSILLEQLKEQKNEQM